MTRQELIAHIERQMEESAQMGEPPSFAFENVTDAAQLLLILRGTPPEVEEKHWTAEIRWLEDELMACMQIVAPGMAGLREEDDIIRLMMVTAIRRLMEADVGRYEALLERWQKRHQSQPQNHVTPTKGEAK